MFNNKLHKYNYYKFMNNINNNAWPGFNNQLHKYNYILYLFNIQLQ